MDGDIKIPQVVLMRYSSDSWHTTQRIVMSKDAFFDTCFCSLQSQLTVLP